MIKTVSAGNTPSALGPYSKGKIIGKTIYFAGQGSRDPASGKVVGGGIKAQTGQACRNIGTLLEEAGTSFDNVAEVTCFLADIADFDAFNEIYAQYFTSRPARTCVAVKDLPLGMLVELKVIAIVG